MTIRQRIGALALLTAWLAGSTVSHATEYTVGPNGDYQAIQPAVDAAMPGDTITVRAGTYKEVHFTRSGAPGQPITLRAYPGERPVIKSTGEQQPLQIRRFPLKPDEEVSWITVQGFEIASTSATVVAYNNANHIEIRNNVIAAADHVGIIGNGHDVVIDGNVVFGSAATHGLYLTGQNYKVTNNLIYKNKKFGIQVAAYKCALSCAPGHGDAINFLIANNVIAQNSTKAGIVIWEPSDTYGPEAHGTLSKIRILNNIFFDNGPPNAYNGVQFFTVKQQVAMSRIENNLFYSSIDNLSLGQVPPEVTVTNNIEADPQFVDADNNDFHPGSIAIGKGQNLFMDGVTQDFDGNPRPMGGSFDIGAYQMSAPPMPPKNVMVH